MLEAHSRCDGKCSVEGEAIQREKKGFCPKVLFKCHFLHSSAVMLPSRSPSGSGRGVPDKNGHLGFWLQVNPRGKVSQEWQETGKGNWGALSSEELNHLKRCLWPSGNYLHIYIYTHTYLK